MAPDAVCAQTDVTEPFAAAAAYDGPLDRPPNAAPDPEMTVGVIEPGHAPLASRDAVRTSRVSKFVSAWYPQTSVACVSSMTTAGWTTA